MNIEDLIERTEGEARSETALNDCLVKIGKAEKHTYYKDVLRYLKEYKELKDIYNLGVNRMKGSKIPFLEAQAMQVGLTVKMYEIAKREV